MHESFLNDTTFWYGVAAVICFVGVFYAAKGGVASWLDSEIAKVIQELEEAKRLRAEADETLKEYKVKQESAMEEAEAIITKAKADAARMREQAQKDLEVVLNRQEQIALDRIQSIQDEAADEVRGFFIEEAMHELYRKLEKFSGSADSGKLIDEIISELPKLKSDKVA